MNITVLDIESYYDHSFTLEKLTIPEYVHDPRFHVYGLAIRWPDGKCEFNPNVKEAIKELQIKFGQRLERTIIVCHHCQFDLYVLARCFDTHPRHFVDTMLLAYHVDGRLEKAEGKEASLRALAERYSLPPKGDLDFMCGVRHPNVEQLAKLSAYAKRDVELPAALVGLLLPQITRPEIELPLMMHTVRLFTERGIKVDVPGIDLLAMEIRHDAQDVLQKAGVTPELLSSTDGFATALEAALARTGRKLPMKPGKRKPIAAVAKTDPEMQEMLEDEDPLVTALACARLQQKGGDQKLARLATLRDITKATGGVLPPYLIYHGAHTGRFAAGGQFNLQNLGRSGTGGRIRGLLMARPGTVFIIGDLAQIEARITAWLAGQRDMLDAFAAERDLYSEFASTTLRQEVRKPRNDDPPELKLRLVALREVGKRAVLGLGFNMGAFKFMNKLRADPSAASLFAGGELSPLICRDIVRSYRRRYSNIKEFWMELDGAGRATVDGITRAVGRLHFDRDGETSRIWLPSGRALRYVNMRKENVQRTIKYLDDFGQESEFTPDGFSLVYGNGTNLYGGKICENVVQAVARDLLVEAMLRLEERECPILFHVHDEVIVEVPEARTSEALQIVEEELSRVPTWAVGLPIGCEVRTAARYGK
jgi:DNA polymerase